MDRKLSRLLLYLSLILSVIGCARFQVAAIDEDAGVDALPPVSVELGGDVSPSTVADLIEGGTATIVDVREAWEYQQGHIPGAALITLDELRNRVDEIPRDEPVILVCRSDNRSGQAQRYLMREGFDNVHNMTGGMVAWEAAGLEIVR
jgi:rhodanese-related sulfurtransferase